jgi:hypothetical protein
MRGRLAVAIAAASAVLLLLPVPAASGAVEVGNRCLGDDTEANRTVISLEPSTSPPLQQVPQFGPYVITRWKVELAAGMGPLAQQLVTLQHAEGPSYRKAGESAMETLVAGMNEFPTRVPVAELAMVGLYGPLGTPICSQQPRSWVGTIEGNFAVGEVRPYEAHAQTGTPVVAIVEPDVDYDEYGDETQDECPWTTAYQTGCPAEKLEIVSTTVKRRAILVGVQTGMQTSVEAFGQVSWRMRQRRGPGGPAGSSKGDRRRTVGFSAGAGKTVAAGKAATFKLPLPKPVLQRLGRLVPRQSLRAKLTVRATDRLNGVVERKLTVRLPGRAQPQSPR